MAERILQWGRFWSSGLAEPAFPAPEPPAPAGPSPMAPAPRGRAPKGRPVVVVLIVAAAAVAVWTARRRQQPAGPAPGTPAARTTKVTSGPMEETLRISGTIAARRFAAIVAPQMRGREGSGSFSGRSSGTSSRSSGSSSSGGSSRGTMGGGGGSSFGQLTLIKLAAAGILVKKGDVIAQFDSQSEQERIDDNQANVIQARAEVDKRRAEIAIEREAHLQLVRQAKADHEKAKLDRKTAEVRSVIDAEKLQLMVEETAARAKQFEAEVALKKVSHDSELRSLEMQAQQEKYNIDRRTRNIERMTIRAPIDGLVVMQTIYRGGQFGQVQEGDQVFPGTYFLQIVDLSEMIVNASVNQVSSHALALGQKATVRLEAYPGLALPAKLVSIGAMAAAGSRGGPRGSSRDLFVKQVPVRFAIEAPDKRLIPDLSASADVVLHRENKALQVPREAVVEQNGKSHVILPRGEQVEKRAIQVGRRNGTHYVVLAGLREGDEVSLEP